MYVIKLKSKVKIFNDVLHHIVYHSQLRPAAHIISKHLTGLATKIQALQKMERELKENIKKCYEWSCHLIHFACTILQTILPRREL